MEKILEMTTYQGKKGRWTFEKYVRMHKEWHAILASLQEHGYAGIDDRSKVRHLLNGIKDKSLNVVKTQVLASATLMQDFEQTTGLYKDFIEA